MTLAFQGIGIGAPNSIALGPAFVDIRGQGGVTHAPIGADEIQDEIARFDLAVEAARGALKRVHAQIPPDTPIEIVEFIDTHLLMLEDTALIDGVRHIVAEQLCTAEWALQRQRAKSGSDFLPHHLQRVVAISCVLRWGNDKLRIGTLGEQDSSEADMIAAFFDLKIKQSVAHSGPTRRRTSRGR